MSLAAANPAMVKYEFTDLHLVVRYPAMIAVQGSAFIEDGVRWQPAGVTARTRWIYGQKSRICAR